MKVRKFVRMECKRVLWYDEHKQTQKCDFPPHLRCWMRNRVILGGFVTQMPLLFLAKPHVQSQK